MDIFLQITNYITESFLHIWPYLLITIPISVLVNISGVGKKINVAFSKKPTIAILLATAIGAFSPLCSCGVIPVIATLLIGGVPLGPVMAFWLSSPSMDIEIFSLTVATLGWNLAIWRLLSTLILSLAAGFITHALQTSGFFGKNILRSISEPINNSAVKEKNIFSKELGNLKIKLRNPFQNGKETSLPIDTETSCCSEPVVVEEDSCTTCACEPKPISQKETIIKETIKATSMVFRFMLLAFAIGGLIHVFVPTELVSKWLGNDNPFAILTASLMGIPIYTSNLTAMPMIGELLSQGMNPGAALAFLIAGPITTLPAMSAVWGLVSRKVFSIYLGFGLVGALFFGYGYSLL